MSLFPADPYFDSVVLLLPFDGTDGDTTTLDLSPVKRSLTFAGAAQLDNAQTKFGSTSLLLDGDDDWVDCGISSDFHPSGDFTVEAHVYVNPGATYPNIIIGSRNTLPGASQGGWWFNVATAAPHIVGWNGTVSGPVVTNTNNQIFGSPTALEEGRWYHVAATRDTSGSPVTWRTFVEGTLTGTDREIASVLENTTESTYIGREINNTDRDFDGHIENLRITKGVCRYTGDFRPPRGPHSTRGVATDNPIRPGDPYFDSVVLHLPFGATDDDTINDGDTETIDYSNSQHPITFVGTSQLDTAETKYGSTFGVASGLFDGNSDYLTAPNSSDFDFGATTLFTIECHVRFAVTPGPTDDFNFLAFWDADGVNQRAWYFGIEDQKFTYIHTPNGIGASINLRDEAGSTWTPSANVWYHVAVVRDADEGSGHVHRGYVDGVQLVTDTDALNQAIFDTNSTLDIGILRESVGTRRWMNGWIDNVRITKGVCRYPDGATFRPPRGPHPIRVRG